MKTMTDEEYKTVVENTEKPIVLQFSADWWPACRQLRPVVSKVAEEETDIDIYYVDVDQSPDLAGQFGIMSIPTLVLIKNGQEADRSIGFIPEGKVKEFIHS